MFEYRKIKLVVKELSSSCPKKRIQSPWKIAVKEGEKGNCRRGY
jgi:hypothetical protein